CTHCLFTHITRLPHRSTLFPYTTLFRSRRSRCRSPARTRLKTGLCSPTAGCGTAAICCATAGFFPARARPISTPITAPIGVEMRSEEHTSELQSRGHIVCRLLLEKKKKG